MRANQLFAAAIVTVSICATLPGFAQNVTTDAGVASTAKDGGAVALTTSAAAGDAAAPTTTATTAASTRTPTLASPMSTMHEGLAAAAPADARAARRARQAPGGGRRVRAGREGLPRHRHDDHQAPLRGEEEDHPLRARQRDQHREGRAPQGARDRHPAARGVHREVHGTRSPRPRPTRCTASPRSTRSAPAPTRRRTICSIGLKPAIALYKRVIKEFPSLPRARRHLLLPRPRATTTRARLEEAQQVWRSLVCHNNFPYPTPTDPKNTDVDAIVPLPQDTPPDSGTDWRQRYQLPKQVRKGQPGDDVHRSVPERLRRRSRSRRSARARTRSTSPRSGGRSETGSSTSSTPAAASSVTSLSPCGTSTAPRAPTSTRSSSRSRRSTASRSTSTPGRSSSSSATRRATRQFVKLLLHTDEHEKPRARRRRRLPQRGVHVHRGLAHERRLRRSRGVGAVHPASGHRRHRAEPRHRRAQAPRRDRSREGPDAHPPGQSLDDRDLQGAREGVPKPQPVQQRGRGLRADPQEVADGSDRAGRAERDRDDVRPDAGHEEERHAGARRDRRQGAPGAHRARELHRQHAVGRREQGQPRRDPERRAPRPRRSPPGGGDAHEHRQAPSSRRPKRRTTRSARRPEPRARRSTSSRRSAGRATSSRTRTRPTRTRAATGSPTRATSRCAVQLILHQKKKDQYAEPSSTDIEAAKTAAIEVRDSNEDDKYLDVAAHVRRRRVRRGARPRVPALRRHEGHARRPEAHRARDGRLGRRGEAEAGRRSRRSSSRR